MERLEFIKKLGTSTLAVCATCGMLSCEQDEGPAPGSGVDFTISIEDQTFQALSAIGGSAIKDDIIIIRTGADTFVALSRFCTHETVGLNYSAANTKLVCPRHGSEFSTSGSVLRGPAQASLFKYKTEFTSPNLRVFS